MAKTPTEQAAEQVRHVEALRQNLITKRAQSEAARGQIEEVDATLTSLGFTPKKAERELETLEEELQANIERLESLLDEGEDE